jgi:hypothetical protein
MTRCERSRSRISGPNLHPSRGCLDRTDLGCLSTREIFRQGGGRRKEVAPDYRNPPHRLMNESAGIVDSALEYGPAETVRAHHALLWNVCRSCAQFLRQRCKHSTACWRTHLPIAPKQQKSVEAAGGKMICFFSMPADGPGVIDRGMLVSGRHQQRLRHCIV